MRYSAAPLGLSPASVSARTSRCPTSRVLIHRCWPEVRAMKKPSSTSSGSVKCWCSAPPHRVVCEVGVPHDGVGVAKGRLLPIAVAIGLLEQEQVVVVLLRGGRIDRALRRAVAAIHGLGDVDTAELLQRMVDHSLDERLLPRRRERLHHRRHMGADGLCLWPRCADPACPIQDLANLWIIDGIDVWIGDVWHDETLLLHTARERVTPGFVSSWQAIHRRRSG